MLDWFNFRLGELIGLTHALEKRYYQNKTQLRYNFGLVYIWATAWEKVSSGVFDQARHKLTCEATGTS